MQRVRIGLTGLAFVFVLVLLGAVFTNASDEEALTPTTIEQPAGPVADANGAEPSEPTEPLAELGVAPGKSQTNDVAPANTIAAQ